MKVLKGSGLEKIIEYLRQKKDPWEEKQFVEEATFGGNPDPYIHGPVNPRGRRRSSAPAGYPIVDTGITAAVTPRTPRVPVGATPASVVQSQSPAAPVEEDPDFLSQYGGALLPYMSQMQGAEEQAGDIAQQQAIAQNLADTELPEGRGFGRVYTAANPLEFLGAGIKQYRGYKEKKKLDEDLKILRGDTKSGRDTFNKAIVEALGRKKKPKVEEVVEEYRGF